MMIALPGFQIVTLLKAGVKAVIYRGIKVKDQCPVIIKGLRPEQCTPNNIEQFKHEYAIAQRLNIAAAVKAYALEMHQGIPYLIMEDFGGRSLDLLLDQFQQPVPFLKIAIEITSRLAQIHSYHIVHKDIKPQNILVNLETNQVKIADFGIAAFIPYEQQRVSSSSRIEGSLPYLSPEQTGRMNRGIDHRSDLYSLGVTFYEMLTGELPFQGKDPLEWVHCHIAKSPPSPKKLNSDIPEMLCDIIIKLLSKVAEQRYQSALGLQFDLERCLEQLQTTTEIQSFVLGEQDISERFQIPQKLYGREQEIAKLLQAFERVVSQGKPEIVFVSGYAGVGKSSLVKEIHKPIVKEHGVFICGKFDEYKRDIPYSTIVQAFQTLVRQILMQPEDKLATWKKRIQAALGNNGRLIANLIPELKLIIGEQSHIPLGPAESQNRFNLVFQNFISVFAQKEHPLTVFLDDMQWADSATLNLIQTIITGSNIQYLCFILAYRDNEIDVVYPINLMMEKVHQYGAKITEIVLTPLNLIYVNQLIADTLHSSAERVEPLAQLIIQKTDGNPFFVNEFLKTLHQENLLNFDRQHGVWQWNLAQIEAQGITDNIVNLMIGRMQKLPPPTQQVLKLASCIGNRFDLEVLAIVGEQSIQETANALVEAILRGLIIPIESDESTQKNYRFYHDRVQQAAYALIADESKSLGLERKFELIAKTYLQAAKNSYGRWEASAKVKQLEECYPQLLPRQQSVSNGTFFTTGEHLDFLSVVKASQTISSEILLSRLLKTLMQIVIEQAGAEIGYLLLETEQNMVIEVEAKVNPQAAKPNIYRPVLKGDISQVIPQSILNYVQRTQETVILPNATELNLFSGDEYVIQKQPKSVLCLPIARQSKLLGILYLENNLIPSAFTQDKLAVLEILTVQIAISLENAHLYQGLENSQEQLNLALKSAQIGVWSWDITNDQFDWDEQTYQLFGLTPETFVATSEAILARLHPDDRGLLAQSLSRAINEGVEHDLEYRIIWNDGSIRYLACRGKAFFNEADKATHMSGVVLDITDRKQSEAKRIQLIQEQTARLEAEAAQQRAAFLAQVSTTLASSLDYESTLTSVANLVVPYFADWCSVNLLQDNQAINQVAVAHRDPEKVKLAWELYQRYPRDLDVSEGVAKVLRTGLAEMVTEISDAALAAAIEDPEHLRILRELGLKSCIILPLMARERIFGAISFVTAESERRYSIADLSLAEDVAHRAAIAIDNARLYQEAQQAQTTAERALERIARLQSITAALSESLTPAQVSEVIVEQSMAALGASSALVALLNESKTELEIVRAVGYNQDLLDTWRHFAIDLPFPLAEAVRTGQPIWAQSRQNQIARYPHLAEIYAQYDIDPWISIPLMVEGWAVGGITLGFAQPQLLSGEDQAFILAVAQQCAQAIARAHLYEAERTARNAAESANRIKDEFLAVLSHELRTPLNPILGWTKLMRTRKLDQLTSDRALETIERNAKLQTQLIEDLLDVSRILQGKLNLNFYPINLVSVIEAAIETVRLSAQAKSIEIQTILESDVGQVLGDANRLQQVIWNILSNAIKFTPTGGQVKIKLEQVGLQVQICITDTGKGIVPEFLAYVFDYFRQADSATTRKFGGLGLGLAIVRHLVELHGGTVQAESLGEGQGATFTVILPCLQDESKGIKDAKDNSSLLADQSSPLSGLQILVVDDDADMREFLSFMLEQYGATVITVTSAIAALTTLSQSQPNLIISDIGMPEMDGYMLMRQVRSLKPEQGGTIPAIALTAYAGEMDQQQAIAVGFQQHISKPVDPQELVKAIVLLGTDKK
ncbi:AAA family ATPase [uncultured Nostoc sp.]|uniref:AAA family ATPase n=1 Tax=uncultured Nostoc sp. TaxID=340711 RepID=UPI00261035F2|nr:AAA family ATPase [uncultured Nostoc sp.]